mmetsp:Transcript_10159/g.21399  ORF Transcript_10159/g.21399 Transcript_10159/m.21399 type:complete len:351 (-) Transcript_10159:1331-2383(-)
MVAVGKSGLFLGWTASQGIETPLDLAHRADGRYMTCNEDLLIGADILRIPLSACITADTLESLAERLAHERDLGAKSKYAPYIDVLPTLDGDDERPSLRSLPRFWDSNRLEKVSDGGRLEAKMMNDERKDLDPWALACVDSRANYLGGERFSMTPILDMITHDGSIQTRARLNEDKGFSGPGDILCLTSGRSFSKGEEAFISYGNLANIDTLSDYGFVSENNPCNSESIGVRMMGRDPFSVTVYADGSVDSGAKATLRYSLANEEELEIFSSLTTKGSGLGILAKPLSDRNELDVQSFIASTLDEAAYDAKAGAAEAEGDVLVSCYLNERAKLLEKAIQRITAKYPDLEY